MKKILGLSLIAAMALTSNVFAEEVTAPTETATADSSKFSISGNAAMTTHYLWRGWSYSDETPTGQAGLDFNNVANVEGLYVGTWGSGIQVGSEVDLYAGFSNSLSEDLSYDAGFIYYYYTLAGSSYGEAYLGLTFKDYSLTVYKENSLDADGITPILDASFGPVDVQAGYYVSEANGNAAFGSVGINWPCMLDETYNMNAMVAYNSNSTNTLFGQDAKGAAVALTISKEF